MKRSKIILLGIVLLLIGVWFGLTKISSKPYSVPILKVLSLKSSAFDEGGLIPDTYTCKGKNINPPLQISNVPKNTKSLMIEMDDLSTSQGPYVHWLLWNIPPNTRLIPENTIPENSITGINSAKQISYTGPCPPSDVHTYRFQLYALDTTIDLPQGADRNQLEAAIKGHILAKGQLTGIYTK